MMDGMSGHNKKGELVGDNELNLVNNLANQVV
jgi:hypothetical protein